MKKIVVIIVLMLLNTLTICVNAADTQELVIPLNNNSVASILLNDTTWNPTAGINEKQYSSNTTFKLENNGTVTVDVNISGDFNRTFWDLEATAGHNDTLLKTQLNGGSNITVDEIQSTWVDNMAHDGEQIFGVYLEMPTSTSSADMISLTVTFTATAD